nr:HNH endonuclease signature motif containing protein [Oceanisphaera pacifica]
MSQKERRRRLKAARSKPEKILVKSYTYKRNPDVVIEVLERAKGNCELCQKPAPFKRKRDLTSYLEVHHIKQLAQGGDDTVENAIALCPNCHREQHFG